MCDFIFVPIFCGTWDQVRSLGPELVNCPRCHNNAIQTIKRRRWFTLYCVPVFPISHKRILYHCDICRWEGVPIGNVQVAQESGRHHRSRAVHSPDDRTRGMEEGQQQPRPGQFESVPYSQSDYAQAPPPPYSKTKPEASSNTQVQ